MSGIGFALQFTVSKNMEKANMKTLSEPNTDEPKELNRYQQETGAMGYILLWAMGVPASLLFLVFLLRGCN
jgi:hypothetical protein